MKRSNWRLVLLTYRWDRNLGKPEPGKWECIDRQVFEIQNKTAIGAKRIATIHIFNDAKTPESFLKHKLWWASHWKLSDGLGKFYRTSTISFKYRMRAELIEISEKGAPE